jgi:hypothetical protein
MPVINQNWYNLNSVRGYPVDDGARGEDDAGGLIPPGLLVDCRLRFPETAGRYAFIGALSVSAHLVTAIFLAADEPACPVVTEASGSLAGVPIAAVSLTKPLEAGRHYPVESLYPGTGGWVVFGDGVEDPYSGRFSSVRQSQILPRCARPYRLLPIPAIGKEFVSGPLTGLVRILGGADIEVVRKQRVVHGQPRDCLVVRLADDLNRNVLQLYAGPCAGRPETRTCARPGLELINTVGPDCDGNVNIEFRHARVTPFMTGGGLTVDIGVGLADACPPPYVPDMQGRLPGEFLDLCSSESLSLASESVSLDSSMESSLSESQQLHDCTGLPFEDGFDQLRLHPSWSLLLGTMLFEADDSPEEAFGQFILRQTTEELYTLMPAPLAPPHDVLAPGEAARRHATDVYAVGTAPAAVRPIGGNAPLAPLQFAAPLGYIVEPVDRSIVLHDTSRRNVLVWDDCGYDYTLDLTCRTHLKMKSGTHMNGGIILNYRHGTALVRPQYHLLLANASDNAFGLWYYNGTNLSKMVDVTMPVPWLIKPDLWYEVVGRTRLGTTGKVVIEATLRGIEQPNMPVANISVAVANYLPADGKFGLGTNQAQCLFSFFELRTT